MPLGVLAEGCFLDYKLKKSDFPCWGALFSLQTQKATLVNSKEHIPTHRKWWPWCGLLKGAFEFAN